LLNFQYGCFWRKAAVRRNVRCWANSGKHMLALMFSAVDPRPSSVTTKYLRERVIDMDQMGAAVFDIQMLV
jgi:hypothetical protein